MIVLLGGDGLIVPGEEQEILEKLRDADGYVELETQDGTVHLNPASVAYVKEGDVVDPIRDTPGPPD